MQTVLPVWPALLAGFAYVVTPGPGFVAMLSCAAVQPVTTGVRFAGGLLIGSAVWLAVTLATIVGAGALPDWILDVIGTACALYLAYLGAGLIVRSVRRHDWLALERPLRDGLMLSLTNPKAFPVFTALFGGWVLTDPGVDAVTDAVPVFIVGGLGIALGYAVMLWGSRAPAIQAFYRAHTRRAAAVFGVIFWLFALDILLDTALRTLV